MAAISNLESWLAEEAAIVQKSDSDQDVYLFEWLQRLEEYLKSPLVTRVSLNCYRSPKLKLVCVSVICKLVSV